MAILVVSLPNWNLSHLCNRGWQVRRHDMLAGVIVVYCAAYRNRIIMSKLFERECYRIAYCQNLALFLNLDGMR